MLDDTPVHGVHPLVLHQAQVEGDRRPVRDDRVGLLPDGPGLEPPDRERRAEHQALEIVSGERDAELPLQGGPVQRDPPEQLALGGGRRSGIGAQALDERRAVRRRHRGEQPGQDPGRVRHAEVPGVDVAAGGLELEGEREDPAGAEHDRRPLAGVLRPVRDEDEVRGQEVPVRLDEAAEAGAPDLLLALEDELEVDPGRHAQRVHEVQSLQVRPDRTLVVGGATRVEPVGGQRIVRDRGAGNDRSALLRQPRAEDRLEGRWLEPASRRRGLRVEVAVDQEGPRRAGHPPLAEHDGVAARLEHARLQPAALHRARQPLRAAPDSLRLLAHGVDPEALDEALEDRPLAGAEGAVEGRPVHVRHGRPPRSTGGR